MARQSKKRRKQEEVEREELLAPDAFEAGGEQVTPWIERHFKSIAIAVGAALVLVAAVELTRQTSSAANAAGTLALVEGTDAYRDAVSIQSVFSSTTAEGRAETLREARAKFAGALEGSGGAATLAYLYDADLARRLGDHEAALKGYERYLSATSKLKFDPLRFFALEGKGMAHEAAGQTDAALDAYRKLEAMGAYADFGSMHVGRVLAAKGDVAGAKTAFEKVVAREPASPLRADAEQQIAALD